MTVLQLAVPSPLRRTFDYLPPPDLGPADLAALQPGQRLRLPFGRREVVGVLLDTSASSDLPAPQLKPALALLDPKPLFTPDVLALCRWAADYYQHPVGEVFSAALPRHLRLGKAREPGSERAWRLTDRGRGLPAGALLRSPRQNQALAGLQGQAAVGIGELKHEGIGSAALRALANKALAEPCRISPAPRPASARPGL
ncbi:MAG: primosomal protein N', partial [Parahaliea sp.]